MPSLHEKKYGDCHAGTAQGQQKNGSSQQLRQRLRIQESAAFLDSTFPTVLLRWLSSVPSRRTVANGVRFAWISVIWASATTASGSLPSLNSPIPTSRFIRRKLADRP